MSGGGFFRRGETVTIGPATPATPQWTVERVRDSYAGEGAEPFQLADLINKAGTTRTVRTEQLTRVEA